jgi:hypothetical protein
MYALRHWSTRHAAILATVYHATRRVFESVKPLCRAIGYDRLESPLAAAEHMVKGALFDCRMCGRCDLSSTGMACPMTCPKQMRNGPCGGVRANGACEVVPDMPCIWLGALGGSQLIDGEAGLSALLPPTDHSLQGRSAWLTLLRDTTGGPGPRP